MRGAWVVLLNFILFDVKITLADSKNVFFLVASVCPAGWPAGAR